MRGASNRSCEHLPLFVMNGCGKTTRLISIVVFSLLQVSCNYWIYDVGIGLIDTRTQSMTFLRSGDYREVVVNIFDQDRSFQTFQRIDNELQLRTITFDGKVLRKQTIPLLFNGYCGKENYAVSPDGSQIIYFNFTTKELRSYDIAANKDSKLMERVDSAGIVAKIHFVSPEEIILILTENFLKEGTGNAIVKFNTVTKIAKTIAEPIYLSTGSYASFSKSNRYLAYWEASQKHSLYGDIRILDLKTSQFVGTIKNPGDVLMSDPCWSPNEQMVACVAGNSLLTAPLSGDPAKAVKTLPENLMYYSLDFLNDETLLYRSGKDGPLYALTALDINTGKETRYSKRAFNGDIFVVENGNRVICELGY